MRMSHAASAPALVTVLGAGAWGSTLARLLANNGHSVRLWTRDEGHARELAATRENARYLPGLRLPPAVTPTSDLDEALAGEPLAFAAVPARALRSVLRAARRRPAAVVSCAKGVEPSSGERGEPDFKRLSQVVEEEMPGVPVAALSGPNLAREIADGKPAATTVASLASHLARWVQDLLQQATFRVYTSPDLVGVELAGVMKNVIALAAGICDGLRLGDNAKSTIITRGLAETVRFGTRLGGRERTFYGLAGLGDVVATCASHLSRNHRAGVLLAGGERVDGPAISSLTAEGLGTVAAVHAFARAHDVDLPITAEVYRVAYERKDPREAIDTLMSRERKAE
jgi:glycerol-3-phosphate dehydrogenase (NAD(P)+)